MKINRLICMIIAFALLLGSVNIAVFAAGAGTNELVVLDCSKALSIKLEGLDVNDEIVNSSNYSAVWDPQKNLVLTGVRGDLSDYSELRFAIYNDSAEAAVIMLAMMTDNSETDGIDYYGKELTLNPGVWNTFTIQYSDLKKNRGPSFTNISNITFYSQGWNNYYASGTKFYLDTITLSGEPTTVGGKTFTTDMNDVGDKIFLNMDFENGIRGVTVEQKEHKIEVREESNGNHYLAFEALETGSDMLVDLKITEPTRFMVVQFDIAALDGKPLQAALQYKDKEYTLSSILRFSDGKLVASATEKELTTYDAQNGTWTNVALAMDFATNRMDMYIDGEKVGTNELFGMSSMDAIALLRIYGNNQNEPGMNLKIDNYKVYEGKEPRELSAEEVQSYLKVTTNNDAGIKALGDNVVALSVGGNGIYYGGEKHPIDAPAFVENDRTLVPVRAVSEAFGLTVDWEDETGTVTINNSAKIIIGSDQMILPDGSSYTLDVPAQTYNDRTFLPLRALCEQVLGKTVTWNDRGLIVIGDAPYEGSAGDIFAAYNYLLYDRPTQEQITALFTSENANQHPRVIIDRDDYNRIRQNYATSEIAKEWGDLIIAQAQKYMSQEMPTYQLDSSDALLSVSRDVLSKAQYIGMAYILTQDKQYSEHLYKILETVGRFPDWSYSHFLDTGEMATAVAIGYDWCYDAYTEEQRQVIEEALYTHGVLVGHQTYYGELDQYGAASWVGGNTTNWSVVCNGGITVASIALFDKYPEMCAENIMIGVRDVEAMFGEFYPSGAWKEGSSYWSYTIGYTAYMLDSLRACFNTDFNLSKAAGLDQTAFYALAVNGPVSINNYHDANEGKLNSPMLIWLSQQYNMPEITNIRLYQIESNGYLPKPYDLIWYDPAITGTDFTLDKDMYLADTELISLRGSWTDDSCTWISAHGGKAVENHSHLDNGTFVLDMLGERWACDLGSDSYTLNGYFSSTAKHQYYRLRPEGHNVYVINPNSGDGQSTSAFSEVEKMESKEKGSYAIINLSQSYADNASSARRGYMLTDDRRSAVVRDEISLTKPSNELYWFMHTRAEIQVVDNKTVLLSRNGKMVQMMIDTNLPDYTVEVMDAKPLPTSPNPDGQNSNAGIKKVAIHALGAAGDCYIQVKFVPYGDAAADEAFENVRLDDWNIEDGALEELPELDMMYVDGQRLEGFMPTKTGYSMTARYDTTVVPKITADAPADCAVEIDQAVTPDEPTTVTVYRTDNPTLRRVYTFVVSLLPKLEDVGTYKRIQVINTTASDEPENNHPASNVSDNNTDAESRWSASGEGAWVELDFGEVLPVDAVGVSVWQGSARTYQFDIAVSEDGVNYETVLEGAQTANQEGVIEVFDLPATVRARYIRYIGYGNSVNKWNSITEFAALQK